MIASSRSLELGIGWVLSALTYFVLPSIPSVTIEKKIPIHFLRMRVSLYVSSLLCLSMLFCIWPCLRPEANFPFRDRQATFLSFSLSPRIGAPQPRPHPTAEQPQTNPRSTEGPCQLTRRGGNPTRATSREPRKWRYLISEHFAHHIGRPSTRNRERNTAQRTVLPGLFFVVP